MKNTYATYKSWTRRVAGLMATLVLTMSFAGEASARVLFQDDIFEDVVSEGLRLNSDDGGDEDVTLQFGNDGTDATVTFDDGLSELIFSGAGIDFSGVDRFELYNGAANPANCQEGEIFYNTTDNSTYICTATDTWTALSSGGSDNFEQVYAADGDDTLTTSDGNFTIDTGTGTFAVTGITNINDSNNTATNINTGTSTGAVTIGGGSGTVAINSSTWDISTAGVASGLTGITSTGTISFAAASSFLIPQGAANPGTCTEGSLFYNTTDNIVYACTATNTFSAVGAGGDAGTLDGLDSTQFLRADASDTFGSGAGAETLTIGDGTNGDTLGFAANSIIDFANATINNLDATDVNYDGTTVDAGLGDREFTSNNVVTDNTSFTAAISALDAAVGSGAPNVDTLIFHPEYPDTVVFADGSNNKGKLEALYDDTNNENYYEWTSQQGTAQDIDLKFRFVLPTDFASVGDFTYRYRTGTATEAENDVEVTVFNATNLTTGQPTQCAADTTNVSTSWATGTLAAASITTGCTGATALDAGDLVEVQIKLLADNTASAAADVGFVSLDYSN